MFGLHRVPLTSRQNGIKWDFFKTPTEHREGPTVTATTFNLT